MGDMEYVLKRVARARAIRISLGHDAQVVVTAPRFALKMMIDAFVSQNQAWIERQQQRLKLRQTANPSLNWDEGVISYLGRLYKIEFCMDGNEKVRFEAGKCLVKPVTLNKADIKKTLLSWLKIQAEKHILNQTRYWAEKMEVKYGGVRFGQQSSRWGSCSGENNLRFNWRLIHFPAEVIDYVVIHELSHTVHHDHSDRFWNLVAKHCPTWKQERTFLKRQAIGIEK